MHDLVVVGFVNGALRTVDVNLRLTWSFQVGRTGKYNKSRGG